MADNDGDKTEAPTPRRRQEAREQGNIARSQDLTAAALIVGAMVMLSWYGPGLVLALRNVTEELLGRDSLSSFQEDDVFTRLLRAVFEVGGAMAPMLIGVALLAIVVNLIQVGFSLNTKRITPNLGALNPFKGIGRIFGKGKGPVQLGLSVAKLVALSGAAWSAVRDRMAQIVAVQQLEFVQIFGLAAGMIYSIGIRIGIVLLVIAIIEYVYQRWKIEQDLKMTKQEVKDEMRRMEGDPQIKQRRKQIAMHAVRERMKKDVPTADVVVTNPTEFAVALKYDQGTMHAPRVVAKGQGLMAQRIREIAIAHGVPILERKPLARALFKLCEVGQEIPEDFYSAVAEILAYVYELTGKSRRPAAV
jgi:flagellar biosynthetic protein FlhB